MAPAVGLSLGTVIGSARFFFRSLVGLLIAACWYSCRLAGRICCSDLDAADLIQPYSDPAIVDQHFYPGFGAA